jgi:hypothetical protein
MVCTLTYRSWWLDRVELVDLDYQRFFLQQLDHHRLYQLALSLCPQSTKRPAIYGNICLEVLALAACPSVAHAGFSTFVGLLHYQWYCTGCKFPMRSSKKSSESLSLLETSIH